jgi:predicted  nucleic acid-binding Zn-ribbon protein
MSAESSGRSRPPQTNSAPDGSGPEEPDSENRTAKDLSELPEPSEKLREFLEEFGERAHTPLSTAHGQTVRAECFEEDVEVREFQTNGGGTEQVEEVRERRAVPWWQAVGNMLEWHANYHKSTLRLEYGFESDPSHEILDIDLDNSWFATYQDQERARLKALERETVGFETCSECGTRWCQESEEHDTEHVAGAFEEPVVVLTGRTASGAGRPPVDHARGLADAWTDGEVRRSLRYILDEKLGLESEQWVRWTQGEPHPGDGENRGYHHAHDIVILDGAAASEEVTAETFRTMIATHVSECDHAGPRAHDLDKSAEQWAEGNVETVSVKHVEEGEIKESVASYAAAYLANESLDLLERSPEYLAWAATMWATESQKGIKSESANQAIAADKCEHKHLDGEQDLAHAEEIRRSPCRCAEAPYGPGCSRCDGRGFHIVCWECGSPWRVEQTETVAEARLSDARVVADGGSVPERETVEQAAEEELRSRWPSARSAAMVGGETAERECHHTEPDQCPLCATETEPPNHTVSGEVPIPESATVEVEEVSVGFERPPRWRAKAIIRDGEEIPATGGTSNQKPLKLRSAPELVVSMAVRGAGVIKCFGCGQVYDTVPEYLSHGCEEGMVGVGWLAPTEPPAEESAISREQFLAALPERYRREEEASGGNDDLDGEGELSEQVRRYVEENPGESAVAIAGRFGLSPEVVEEIGSVEV